MKAAVLTKPGKFEVREIKHTETDGILPDHARIRVRYVGICGSDVHSYKGENAFVTLPIIPGHEFLGIAVIVNYAGGKTGNISEGDLVTVEPTIGCMECRACKDNRRNNCSAEKYPKILGCQANGAFGEYVDVPLYMVHKLAGKGSYGDRDAMAGALAEPAAVGIHAAKLGGIQTAPRGSRYFVQGAGIIGLMVASAVRYLGSKFEITASDLVESRLRQLRVLGYADNTLNVREPNNGFSSNEEWLKFVGDGFDTVIDASGSGRRKDMNDRRMEAVTTLETAINLAKRGSGVVVQLGITDELQQMISNVRREVTVKGSRVYNKNDFELAGCMLRVTSLPSILDATLQDGLNTPAVAVFNGLESVTEAFEAAQSGKHLKVMVKVWE